MRTVVVRDVPLILDDSFPSAEWWCDQLDSGEWEPDTFDAIDKYAPARFLDIGAWCGIFSLYAAKKYGSYCIAFEPDPVAFKMLTRNRGANGHTSIVAHNGAIWSHDGLMDLHVHGELGDSMSGIARSGVAFEVFCGSVDSLRRAMPDPDLAKIDIEGAEAVVWPLFREAFDCPVHLSWHRVEARQFGAEIPDLPRVGGDEDYPTFLAPAR